MRVEAAIFDLDGTLIDSMPLWSKAPAQLVRRFGAIPSEHLAEEMGEMGQLRASAYLVERFHLSCTPEEVMQGVRDLMTEEYRLRVPMKPGADRLLYRMRLMKIPCCVATASEVAQARAALTRLGLWNELQFALSGVQYGEKTGPELYLAAARRLGVKPGHIVVFEDALHAVRTAKEAGFQVAGVYDPSAERDQPAIRELADWYLRELNDWQP